MGSSDRGGLGIGVPYHSVGLNSGKIFSLGPDGQSAEVDLRHGALAHDRNHKVDGGISRPRLVSAAADGATLTVTFDEALDTGFVPAPGAFRVTVNGARRNVASGGVSIAGASVTLTLASPVAGGDTVALRYVKSGSTGLRNAAGYLVESFADQEVTTDEAPDETPADGLWSATLTVAGTVSNRGCYGGGTHTCSSALTADSFTTGGNGISDHGACSLPLRRLGTQTR